jgi:hypothetical protein
MKLQLKSFNENSRLFRPPTGVSPLRITSTTTRAEHIIEWIKTHESFTSLILDLHSTLEKLSFGGSSDLFEEGIDKLGICLGFDTDRPENKLGVGPDNLWKIEGKGYWIIECKNEVLEKRKEIYKNETEQLLSSIGWFKTVYRGESYQNIMIHPSNILADDAFINEPMYVININELEELKKKTLNFYTSLDKIKFEDLSVDLIKKRVQEYNIDHINIEKDSLKRAKKKL